MKRFRKGLFLAAMMTAAVCTVQDTLACGKSWQISYMKGEKKYFRLLEPREILDWFMKNSPEFFSPHVFRDGNDSDISQIQDFAAAVKRHFPKMPEAEQKKMVTAWTNYYNDFTAGRKNTLTTDPNLPEELQEFYLYIRGFNELEQKKGAKPESWYKLLSLPPERRHFRTVWVHYILGNWDSANVHTHAENCRKAAADGFSDTSGLAWASYKQEIRQGTDPVKMIRAVVEGYRGNPEFNMLDYFMDYSRKYGTVKGLFVKFSEKDYQRMMEDPIGREFALIFDVGSERFQKYCKDLKFRNSAILAYHYWNKGEIELARTYLAKQDKTNLISLYLEAELAFYDGKEDLAVQKLNQWLALEKQTRGEQMRLRFSRNYPPAYYENATSDLNRYFLYGSTLWKKEIYGKLGSVMVSRKQYVKAAEFFFRAGRYESDFPHIAELYLTLEELCALTDKLLKEFPKETQDRFAVDLTWYEFSRNVAHLTARRAFREGKYDIARKYMPEEYKRYLEAYLDYVAYGEDIKNRADNRAIALYNAAKIMRFKGLELCGTEFSPDNRRWSGNYTTTEINPVFKIDFSNCECKLEYGPWTLCGKHAAVVREHAPGFLLPGNKLSVLPHKRWHYRIRAAELALQAGELTLDEDLRALIHFFGGSVSQDDIFYKRLVNLSRNTKLGKLADQKRWFPKNILQLQKEISIIDPILSLEDVKFLMNISFPEPAVQATEK